LRVHAEIPSPVWSRCKIPLGDFAGHKIPKGSRGRVEYWVTNRHPVRPNSTIIRVHWDVPEGEQSIYTSHSAAEVRQYITEAEPPGSRKRKAS
jgi:hypothetical protein